MLDNTRKGTIVGLLMIGALVASLIAGKLADSIGRKHSISIWAFTFMAGSLIHIASQMTWYQVVVGRTIEGLGIGGLSVLVPVYLVYILCTIIATNYRMR